MRNSLSAVYRYFHHAILVDTNRREHVKSILVASVDPVKDQAYNDLLPSWPSLIPKVRLLEIVDTADILQHAMKCPHSQNLVLPSVGNRDHPLGVAVVHGRAKIRAISNNEFIRIAGSSSICTIRFEHNLG